MGWVACPYSLGVRKYWVDYPSRVGFLKNPTRFIQQLLQTGHADWSSSAYCQVLVKDWAGAPVPTFRVQVRLPWITWPGLGRGQRKFRMQTYDNTAILAGRHCLGPVDGQAFRTPGDSTFRWKYFSMTPDIDGVLRLGRETDLWLPGLTFADVVGYQGSSFQITALDVET